VGAKERLKLLKVGERKSMSSFEAKGL